MVRRATTKEIYDRLKKQAQASENKMENAECGSANPSTSTAPKPVDPLTATMMGLASDAKLDTEVFSQSRPRAVPKKRLVTAQVPLPTLSDQILLPKSSAQGHLPTLSDQIALPTPSAQQVDHDAEMEDVSSAVTQEVHTSAENAASYHSAFPSAAEPPQVSRAVVGEVLDVHYKGVKGLFETYYEKLSKPSAMTGSFEFNEEFMQGLSRATSSNLASDIKTCIVSEVTPLIVAGVSKHFQDAAKAAATTFIAEIKASDTVMETSRKRKRRNSEISEPESRKQSESSKKDMEMISRRLDALEKLLKDSVQGPADSKSQPLINTKSIMNDSEVKIDEAKLEVLVNVKYIGKTHLPGSYNYHQPITYEAAEINSLRDLDGKVTAESLGRIKAYLKLDKSRDVMPRVYRIMTVTGHKSTGEKMLIGTDADYHHWVADKKGSKGVFQLDFEATLTDDEALVKQWTAGNKTPLNSLGMAKGRWFTAQPNSHNNSD